MRPPYRPIQRSIGPPGGANGRRRARARHPRRSPPLADPLGGASAAVAAGVGQAAISSSRQGAVDVRDTARCGARNDGRGRVGRRRLSSVLLRAGTPRPSPSCSSSPKTAPRVDGWTRCGRRSRRRCRPARSRCAGDCAGRRDRSGGCGSCQASPRRALVTESPDRLARSRRADPLEPDRSTTRRAADDNPSTSARLEDGCQERGWASLWTGRAGRERGSATSIVSGGSGGCP